jgi:hypothetical protein
MGEVGHILISGTGRAGTTLLVRIFTRLGLNTGYSEKDIASVEKLVGHAGLERKLSKRSAISLPEIFKSPHAVDTLEACLRDKWLKVDTLILPVRNLEDAAQSRINVQMRAKAEGKKPKGGLWKTKNAQEQKWVLAEQLYRILDTAVRFQVPIILVSFPRFATDFDCFHSVFGEFLSNRYGLDRLAIKKAYDAEVVEELITLGSDPIASQKQSNQPEPDPNLKV